MTRRQLPGLLPSRGQEVGEHGVQEVPPAAAPADETLEGANCCQMLACSFQRVDVYVFEEPLSVEMYWRHVQRVTGTRRLLRRGAM